jgi:prophage tail gpP-like protein
MTDALPSTTLDDIDVTAKMVQPEPAGGDDLTLTIGNTNWIGWQRVQLTRSMDTVPANFDIMVTERYPNQPDIEIAPGAACSVKLGGDLVLTGWIDRYEAALSAGEHTVHISGRSKSADLVDCAAFIGGQDPTAEQYQLSGSAVSIIRQLAKAYGIEVTSQAPDDGPQIPVYNINLGETAWEIIDRLTKAAQVVAYDMPDGSLMIAQAGKEQMASGFAQGANVEAAEVHFTMDQRFSVYEGFAIATPIFTTTSGGHQAPTAIARDDGVTRFRKRIIINSIPDIAAGGLLLPKLVEWEKNRRAGRSLAVAVTCDSWRDTSNNLWAPNHLAQVNIPAVKIPNASWVIGQVTYTKDERGRHAIVLLMPKDAFVPEPVPFMPAYPTAQSLGIGPSNPTAQEPPAEVP